MVKQALPKVLYKERGYQIRIVLLLFSLYNIILPNKRSTHRDFHIVKIFFISDTNYCLFNSYIFQFFRNKLYIQYQVKIYKYKFSLPICRDPGSQIPSEDVQ